MLREVKIGWNFDPVSHVYGGEGNEGDDEEQRVRDEWGVGGCVRERKKMEPGTFTKMPLHFSLSLFFWVLSCSIINTTSLHLCPVL